MSQSEKQNNSSDQRRSKFIHGVDDNQRNRTLRVKVLLDAARGDDGEDDDGGLREHAQGLLADGDGGVGLAVEHDGEDRGGADEAGDERVDEQASHGVVGAEAGERLDALVDGNAADVGVADDEGVVDAGEDELGKGGEEEGHGDVLEGGAVEEELADAVVAGHFFFLFERFLLCINFGDHFFWRRHLIKKKKNNE